MPPARGGSTGEETDVGAGDWVTGGVRRAVSGVAALLPGSSGQEPDEGQAPPEAATSDLATSASPEPAPAPTGGARPRRSRATASAPEPDPQLAVAPAVDSAEDQPAPAPAARRTAARKPAPRKPAPPEAADEPPADEPAAAGTPAPSPRESAEAPAEAPAATWSAEELDGFRSALDAEIARLREELDMGEADLADLVADSGDGSGDDQADAGSKTFEREHEMSVNANTREMIDQALRARARLDAGTYGICERCGAPIAIGRLRAYPRATLCIRCKQAEERR